VSRIAPIIAVLLATGPVSAQIAPAEACADGRISFVFIDNNSIFDTADPDLDARFRWAYEAANKLHIRTRQWVIRRELMFRPGDCYDPFVLAETERILRAYPFLSTVDIYGVPQTDGTHHVIVDTHDDWSTRFDVRLKLSEGSFIEGVRLTEHNFLGMGQTLGLFWQERDVTRDYGLTYWAPQLGRSRWDFAAALGRTRAGTLAHQRIAYPFVGELGHWAGRESFLRDEQFFDYILFDDDDRGSPHIVVPTRDQRFESSLLRRFGDRGRALTAGVGISSRQLAYTGSIDIVPADDFDDRVPADSFTAGPVQAQNVERDALRMHVLLAARDVRWIERRGLDGLRGAEDIRLGLELGADLGRSIPAYGDDDVTLAGLLYGAAEFGGSLFATRGRIDALRNLGTPRLGSPWEDVIATLELFAYLRPSRESPGMLLLRLDAAGGWNTRTPFQLTLGGRRGLRGYDRERYPGGRRLVVSAEHRHYLGWPFGGLFDTGLALFADAGRVWRGDAPFGIDSGWRVSAGSGLRFAFPAGGRSTFRVDLAWPVERKTTLRDFRVMLSIGEAIGIGRREIDLQLRRSRPEGVAGDLVQLNPEAGS
jgi:hypothetical protein